MILLSLSNRVQSFRLYALFFLIILVFGLGLAYMLVPDQTDDSAADMDKIAYRICNNESPDPSDWERMRLFLRETEEVTFENDLDLQDYLCGRCKDCFFPKGDREIEKWFGATKNIFHLKIKKQILKASNKVERVSKFLKKVKNPDIGVNKKTGRIVFRNTQNALETVETNLLLKNFKP